MKTFGLTVNLKDDPQIISAYKAYHEKVWPEVISALKEIGVVDMKIWLKGRSLFMFLQVLDHVHPQKDLMKYIELHPKCKEWEELMGTFQEPVPAALDGEKWTYMEEIFELSRY